MQRPVPTSSCDSVEPPAALGREGEERVRSCFSDGQRSKLREKIHERFLRLGAAALANREALVALPVAEDDREGDLLQLRRPDPLADRLGGPGDLDPVA